MSDLSASDGIVAAFMIGTPIAVFGVLGLTWLERWRDRREQARADRGGSERRRLRR